MIKPSDIYPELFHYTTLGGLEGILKSQSLWATHYQDLNDSQEMIYAKQVLKKHVVPYLINQIEQMVKTGVLDKKQIDIESPVGSPANFIADRWIDNLIQASLKGNIATPYIFSFCAHKKASYEEKNGLLSQWRGYGADGGYALIFNTERLEALLHEEGRGYSYARLELSDVVYGGDEKKFKEEFASDTKLLCDQILYLEKLGAGLVGRKEFEMQDLQAILKCMSRLKHPGFSEEAEVRLVAFLTSEGIHSKSKLTGETRKVRGLKRVKEKRHIDLFEGLKEKFIINKIIIRDRNISKSDGLK